jgi:hypothetical protein
LLLICELPFGFGQNIMKGTTTLLQNYSFEAVNQKEELAMESVGIGEKKGLLLVRVFKNHS